MLYSFDNFTLDTQRYELRRAGQPIPLEPQVFKVLTYLVQHYDRVVPRQELFERLWPDQYVSDDALGRCIRKARRAISASSFPRSPCCVCTGRSCCAHLRRRT